VRVTHDARYQNPIQDIADSEFDTLEWHAHLLTQMIVPVTTHNPQNTDDSLNIEYSIKYQIKKHSSTDHLWREQLDKTYNQRP